MKKTIIILLLVAFVISCVTINQNKEFIHKNGYYPQWFIYPEDCITGYAQVYFTSESSIKEASKKAIENYQKFNYCVVMGVQMYIQSPNGLDLVYDSLFIHVEESSEDENFLKKKFAYADTFSTERMSIIGHSDKPLGERKIVPFRKWCGWVETPPEDKDYFYAIGSTSNIFREHKAWEDAENNAILNLARKITMKNAVETLINEDTMMRKFNEEVNVELKNIKIIERWKDSKTNSYYVLIRM